MKNEHVYKAILDNRKEQVIQKYHIKSLDQLVNLNFIKEKYRTTVQLSLSLQELIKKQFSEIQSIKIELIKMKSLKERNKDLKIKIKNIEKKYKQKIVCYKRNLKMSIKFYKQIYEAKLLLNNNL